jgi:hypothetical protein
VPRERLSWFNHGLHTILSKFHKATCSLAVPIKYVCSYVRDRPKHVVMWQTNKKNIDFFCWCRVKERRGQGVELQIFPGMLASSKAQATELYATMECSASCSSRRALNLLPMDTISTFSFIWSRLVSFASVVRSSRFFVRITLPYIWDQRVKHILTSVQRHRKHGFWFDRCRD